MSADSTPVPSEPDFATDEEWVDYHLSQAPEMPPERWLQHQQIIQQVRATEEARDSDQTHRPGTRSA